MGERIVYDKKETGMPVSFRILSESKKWLFRAK